MFVELDTRQDGGYTISLEWDRDTDDTQVVIADRQTERLSVVPVPGANAGDAVSPSIQVRAVITNGRDGAARRSADEDRDAAPVALAERLGTGLGPAATFATTEHFNLQTARATTVSEANGRASIYLAALSSNLIALAFIGQMSRLGTAFYAFALILLPVLAFVGAVTFVRLVQSSNEEIAYAHRIGLLRTFYLRLSPELEPYLVTTRETRSAPSAWQLTLTAAGMLAVINSVVLAACAGLLIKAAGVDSLAIALVCGAVIGAGAFSLHERHHRRALHASSPDAVDLAAILVSPPQHGQTELASGGPPDHPAPGG